MLYRIADICQFHEVVQETARIWAVEFSEYLSPTATPGKHKHRMFTPEDMQVFSLVAALKKQGMTYADIHAALKNGQRGDPAPLPPEESRALVAQDRERQLVLENEYLHRVLLKAQEELKQVEALRSELTHSQQVNIRLEAQLEIVQKQQERLETQIRELSRELGREYAKGFTDALREKGNLLKPE